MTHSIQVNVRSVGLIHSRFIAPEGMPIQTAAAGEELAVLEVFEEFREALQDIEGFEFLILLTHMHLCTRERLQVMPFLDDQTHGAFATRAPSRPNRIGLSIVRLESVDGLKLHFSGNDMVDGTPVLDIKPYVPAFDVRQTERIGWFGGRMGQLPTIRSDDRMG